MKYERRWCCCGDTDHENGGALLDGGGDSVNWGNSIDQGIPLYKSLKAVPNNDPLVIITASWLTTRGALLTLLACLPTGSRLSQG